MSIEKLFFDRRAARLYAEIPASADIGAVADLFCRIYWQCDRDNSMCYALEFHVRQCAIVACDNFEVLQALHRIENCIVQRKAHIRARANQAMRAKARAVKTRARV